LEEIDHPYSKDGKRKWRGWEIGGVGWDKMREGESERCSYQLESLVRRLLIMFLLSCIGGVKENLRRSRVGWVGQQQAILLSIARLSYGLHTRYYDRFLKWHTPTMSCWKSRRSCSSRGLPWKQTHQGLSNVEWHYKTTITHRLAHWHAVSRRTIYSLLSTHTHTHIHTERGESSKLRCGFVSLMNLQRDSIESPFTYMYVINTTYYYHYY
jgi:hypothetical protein